MSTQRSDTSFQQSHTQARTPRPRPMLGQEQEEQETLDDAEIMYSRAATRIPGSARRYRSTTEQPAPEPHTTITKRQPLHVQVHHEYLMDPPVKARRSRVAPSPTRTQEQPAPSHRRWFTLTFPHWHPVTYIGLTMLSCLVLWVGSQAVIRWWDDTIYGYPRISQYDAVVGHNDSPSQPSHFIAINLHGRIEVIEFPGGDASHAKVYIGPMLSGYGQDRVRVTLSFRDVNHDGRPDMLIYVEGQPQPFVFLNDNGGFRPVKPTDHLTL